MSETKYGIIKDGEDLIAHQSQNVTEHLEFAKEQRELQTDCKADLHHVARVPFVMIEKLINEGKLPQNCLSDKDAMKKALRIIATEYKHFMCTEKKVL